MYKKLDDNLYILSLNKKYTFPEFCSLLKIQESSFGAKFLGWIYQIIFILPSEESDLYDNFYSSEYSTFSEYLQKARNIYLNESITLKKYVFLLYYSDPFKALHEKHVVYNAERSMFEERIPLLDDVLKFNLDTYTDTEYNELDRKYIEQILILLSKADNNENKI